ncbi:MAG TPA: hypothetical protein VL049_29740 [Candidatus Dormibacteraeota bacterium]|nr:hypothetical protein [Candidatus Dormibacteraeota bacterium]
MNPRAEMTRRDGNGAAQSDPSVRELVEESGRVREEFIALTAAALHLADGCRSLLRDRLERQPYATLAVAAGVGYVLGGGLPTPLARVLIGVGGRFAVEHVLAQLANPRPASI